MITNVVALENCDAVRKDNEYVMITNVSESKNCDEVQEDKYQK